jgi:hypothetical protein
MPKFATYCEVRRDQVEQVFTNLDYFDGVNFTAQAQAKALFFIDIWMIFIRLQSLPQAQRHPRVHPKTTMKAARVSRCRKRQSF